MGTERKDLHRIALVQQAGAIALALQRDVALNAITHKQWAIAQTVELLKLQERIADTIDSYETLRAKLRRLRDEIIPNDLRILDVGAGLMVTPQAVIEVAQFVADHIDVFAAMPRTTYAEIIAACDYLIVNITPPEEL